jgi:hypothetical protein
VLNSCVVVIPGSFDESSQYFRVFESTVCGERQRVFHVVLFTSIFSRFSAAVFLVKATIPAPFLSCGHGSDKDQA